MNDEIAQGGLHTFDGVFAVSGVDDQLRQQRIIKMGDLIACSKARVHADARSLRRDELQEFAGAWQKARSRVFSIDAALDGMSVLVDVALLKWEFLSRRNTYLPVNEVEPRDEFGDGVLNLQAGVHFEKVERLKV